MIKLMRAESDCTVQEEDVEDFQEDPSEMKDNLQFDDILKSIGEFGRWQKILYVVSSAFVLIPSGFQVTGLLFITGTPGFHCMTPNVTCEVNKCCDECKKYVFDGPFFSTATEWNLICNRAYINANIQASYSAGMLVGSLVFGAVSDIYGRRFCMLLCSVILTAFSLGTVFVQSLILFACLRAATAACLTGFFVSHYVYILELVGPSYRTLASKFTGLFWVVGHTGIVLIAYYIHYWRHLLLVASFPPILFVVLWWVLPESPRWLVLHGRLDEASDVLLKYSGKSSVTFNGRSLRNALVKCRQMESDSQMKQQKHSPIDLVRTMRMRTRTFILWFNWITINVAFYGFLLYISNLAGSPYLNTVYMQLSDVPSVFIVWIILQKFGRRVPHCVFMILGGASCLLVLAVPEGQEQTRTWLALIGRNLLNMAFAVIFLYSSELYPTSLRNLALGACSTSGRVGAIVAPYIVMLSQLPGVSITLPMTIFGVLNIFSCLLVLFLPETLNSNIPQTTEEMENANEYYGFIWMGRRVSKPLWCLRFRKSDNSTSSEVIALTDRISGGVDNEESEENEPLIRFRR